LLNLLVFGMDVQQAMDAARFRHYDGVRVALEAPISDSVRSALTGFGHEIIPAHNQPFGGSQAIIRLQRGYMAGSDPRKDGYAAGY
jgi:gamma-glutamyltranspeptidase/glutathione hydrolase